MNWIIPFILGVAVVMLIVAFFYPRSDIKVIKPESDDYFDHVVDNVIDYRFMYPLNYWDGYYPWRPFGYRTPHFIRVGGSPHRYRKGGRKFGGRPWRGHGQRRSLARDGMRGGRATSGAGGMRSGARGGRVTGRSGGRGRR